MYVLGGPVGGDRPSLVGWGSMRKESEGSSNKLTGVAGGLLLLDMDA